LGNVSEVIWLIHIGSNIAPHPAPHAFSEWLAATIGPPNKDEQIILVGLMLEICVLCRLQELRYRGYRANVLFEGVDTCSGDIEQKRLLCETLFPFWGQAIYWREIATSPARNRKCRGL
jgi:nicotinamidase-related amidase